MAAEAGGGLALCSLTYPAIVQNNLIYGNLAGTGGALGYCYSYLRNNTIYGNIAIDPFATGGVYSQDGTVMNNIIWGNSGDQLALSSPPSYCCIEDWTSGGTGNISPDPLFVEPGSPTAPDLHLLPASPCIDAGGYVPGLTQDFDGEPRPWDGTGELRGDGSDFDIGADEYYTRRTAVTPPMWPLYP